MDAVSLAAGQLADQFLLLRAAEVEAGQIRTRIQPTVAQLDLFVAAADLFINGFRIVQRVTMLIDIRQLDRLAEFQFAAVRLLLPDDHLEQRRLADAVRTDHADDTAARQRETAVVDQLAVAEALAQVLDFQHTVAKTWAWRNLDRDVILLEFKLLPRQFFIAVDAGLVLLQAARRRAVDPFQFLRKDSLPRRLLLFDDTQNLLFLLQPAAVVAFERDAAAVFDFQNPLRDVVEEVTVMRHDDDSAFVFTQRLFKPCDRFGVQMVGRFVQQQQIWLGQQRFTQGDTAAFTAGQLRHIRVVRRQDQRGTRNVQQMVDVPSVQTVDFVLQIVEFVVELLLFLFRHLVAHLRHDFVIAFNHLLDRLHGLLQIAAHGLFRIQFRLLRNQQGAIPLQDFRLALDVLVDARHDAEQRGLTCAVFADDADLCTIIE